MASSLTPEKRARRYLQASQSAGYTGLPPEHRAAYEQQMAGHERAYKRVREHALAGADSDFDEPLSAGEREHQRELRRQHGMQQADVQRIRRELREPSRAASSSRSRPPRSPSPAGGRRRASTAAAAGAAASATDALHAATSGSGSTLTYAVGIGLLLILVYLLIAGKGSGAITGIVKAGVGTVGAFVKPVDPIEQLEAAFGAKELHQEDKAPAGSVAYGSPITGNKGTFVQELAKLTGLNLNVVEAWANHEQGSSTVEGGNNWLNVETGGPGGGSGPDSPTAKYVERLSPRQAAAYTAEWLRKNIPSITASAGKTVAEQVAAIENSGYAESHYGHASADEFLSAAR